ncbi:MAG: sensor histidine kinase [Bacteroidales bacterium]|nr:sensor histidine kinase [Bacteroidales bacterium]
MKKIIFTGLVLLFVCNLFAQTQNVDSLVNLLNAKKLSVDEQFLLHKDICQQSIYNDTDMLKTYAEKGLILAEKEKNKTMLSVFNAFIGVYFFRLADYAEALKYTEKALNFSIETGNEKRQGELYVNIAFMYGMLGDFAKELEYNLKSLAIFEKTDNKLNFITLLVNLGTTYRSLSDYDRARQYFDKANILAEETDYAHGKLLVAYGYAGIYYNEYNHDKALEYYLRAFELSEATNNKDFKALSAQSLCAVYLEGFNDIVKAQQFADESLVIAKELGDPFRIRGSFCVLADIHLRKKQYQKADEIAMMAWKIDSLDMDITPNLASILTKANIRLDNKDKAEYFLKKYIEINGEKNMKNIQEVLLGMEVKYETEKKELQIAALEEEKKLYTIISIAGVAILLLALGLLLFRYRLNVQKRKLSEQQRELSEQRVKQLEQEQQLIATQAVLDGETAERSRLARDLHDGLGGMLSVVKLNLKDMNHYAIMDGSDVERYGKALDMLDQSIGELRRVAHHIMPESLMRYGLKVSLEDFCQAVPGAHFQYLGENPRLDSRLEVLIYRCAYELVNNAVKHAQSTAINVQLMIDNGLVSLTVHDDGVGFDAQTVKSGIGLENIRTRLAMYNGKMTIHSSPDKGTEVSVEIEQAEQ